MKYYLSVIKTNANIAYKSAKNYNINFVFMIFGNIISIFVKFFLWFSVFQTTKINDTGFALDEVFVYVILSGAISFFINQDTSYYVSQDIKDGSIVYSVLRPYTHMLHHFANSLGTALFNLKYICTLLIFVLLLYCFYTQVNFYPLEILLSFITVINSFLILFFFNYIIGLFSYITMNNWGSENVKSMVIQFFSGEMIPLFFLPTTVYEAMKFTPFFYTIHFSICVCLGKLAFEYIIVGIVVQFVWIVLFYILCKFFWKVIEKHISVNGG